MVKHSKGNLSIIKAIQKGYKALEDGTIISPKGRKLKVHFEKNRPLFVFYCGKDIDRSGIYKIAVHRFIAYYFYSDLLEGNNYTVKFKDGNYKNLIKENLLIKVNDGTFKPKELKNKGKFNQDQLLDIRARIAKGEKLRAIGRLYNTSGAVIHDIKWCKTYNKKPKETLQ